MFNFIENYIFYKCNEQLLSDEDKNCIDENLQNKCEYRKHYKLACSEFLLYKIKVNPTEEIQNKYVLVGGQDVLFDIFNIIEINNNIKEISDLQDNSSENSIQLDKLIHLDFVSLIFPFSKNAYTQKIDFDQFKIECEKKIPDDTLFYYETSSFDAIFSILYSYMLKNNYNLSINIDRENEYLDMIYNLNNVYSFMNIYTFMETLENINRNKIIVSKNINDCNCNNKRISSVDKILIDIECKTSYYLYSKPKNSSNTYCKHNIRGLRHAIVHGCDNTNDNFTKDSAVESIKQDFNDVMHLMISYIEQILVRNNEN